MAAPLRAGRLARSRQPHRSTSDCATNTTSTCATPRDRLSSVDYETPGGRFVIAGDDLAALDDQARGAAAADSHPLRHVARGGLGPRPAQPEPASGWPPAPASRSRSTTPAPSSAAATASSSTSGPTACRPPSRATCPSSTRGRWTCPATDAGPAIPDRRHPDRRSHRRRQPDDHGPRLRRRVHADLDRRRCSTRLLPSTIVEVNYMGSWTLGADNATVRNVPEPGPGAIQARREIPALGAIRSIRFDGKSIYHGATFRIDRPAASPRRLQRQLHALDFEGRCLQPGRDGGREQRAAGRREHLRRVRRVGALQLRSPASVRRPAARGCCRATGG